MNDADLLTHLLITDRPKKLCNFISIIYTSLSKQTDESMEILSIYYRTRHHPIEDNRLVKRKQRMHCHDDCLVKGDPCFYYFGFNLTKGI